MPSRIFFGFPVPLFAIFVLALPLAFLSGCAARQAVAPPAAASAITLHGRILTLIDQPPMLLLSVAQNNQAEGRLLRHGPLSQELYAGDMVAAVVSADCWRKNTLGAAGDFCLAETLTKIDEPDTGTLEQAAPEEVSAEEFRAALAGKLPGAVILDVRSRQEMARGFFKKAIVIPLDELAARHRELPKNKEILIHCASGERAKMAAYELNRLGFQARFLPLDVPSPECACPFDGK